MKIVFFGTSEVGLPILEALQTQHEIIHVVTSPDSKVGRKQELTPTPIAQFADEQNLPLSKPEKVKNNPAFIEFLKTLGADIFVVVSYGKILPLELIEIPKLKTINVHFSLLPKYRGPAPIQYALMNGETTTGTTIFLLDELVDHGPVLASKKIEIDQGDTFATLANKLANLSAELILEVLPGYETGAITPQEQNHNEETKTHMISKQDGKIDWQNSTPQEIYNKFRAFSTWPGIWATYNGKVLKIISCELEASENNAASLKITEVQLEGKTKMTMKDFLNGHPDFKTSDLT